MKLFTRKQRQPVPERRQVSPLGRTNAYAYYARRSPERAITGRQLFREAVKPETAKRAAHYWSRRFGLLIVIIVVVVSLVSVLGVSTDPKIVSVDGSQSGFLHDMPTYERSAQKLFEGSLWNRNKITINTGSISANLKRQFPELSIMTIDLPLIGHRPIIYIAPADNVLVLAITSGYSYVVDASGRVVARATADTAATLRVPTVKDESGASVQVGQLALPEDTVTFIRTVVYQLDQKHMAVKMFALPAGKSELDLYLAGQPYYVKFNLQSGSALQQVGTLFAVQHDLGRRGVTPGQYIDVRMDGRAYYK